MGFSGNDVKTPNILDAKTEEERKKVRTLLTPQGFSGQEVQNVNAPRNTLLGN